MGESATTHPYRDAPPGASPLARRVPRIARINVVLGDFAVLAALFFFDAMCAMGWFLPSEHTIDSAAGIVLVPIMVLVLGPLIVVHVYRRLVAVRCLRFGVATYATLRDRTMLSGEGRVPEVYRLAFTFKHGEKEYDFTTKTYDGELGLLDPRCQIVFLPGQEQRAFLVDTLPGRPRIGDDNAVDPRNHMVGGIMAIVLLVVAVVVNPLGAFLWLR